MNLMLIEDLPLLFSSKDISVKTEMIDTHDLSHTFGRWFILANLVLYDTNPFGYRYRHRGLIPTCSLKDFIKLPATSPPSPEVKPYDSRPNAQCNLLYRIKNETHSYCKSGLNDFVCLTSTCHMGDPRKNVGEQKRKLSLDLTDHVA
ncbi:hypothetical protein O181_013080 [Austropuccinia psidii MF-1]|uniref:Uncharacterized protein n=1 Tax=Austropuccinia psidii MF-1 TaxID=1389203 RepID=A0A9Q3GNJ9_9BASI|nr:hypothetical protein [Austropuccinia psidii MF-1]